MPRSYPGRGHRYDVVVVGAGVAGSEAAWALAGAGADVLLVTTSLDTVYRPAAERVPLEAPAGSLGAAAAAELELAADGSVGAWALHRAVKYLLEDRPGLHLLQSSVSSLEVEGAACLGVRTWEGVPRHGSAVALTVGSFLRARLRVGEAEEAAGRLGEMSYDDLADDLAERGFALLPSSYRAGGEGGTPEYRVDFLRFADEERAGQRLPRLGGLWGAGVVLRGPMSYDATVEDGLRLARQLRPVSSRGSV